MRKHRIFLFSLPSRHRFAHANRLTFPQ
jgi:hypothetical protein